MVTSGGAFMDALPNDIHDEILRRVSLRGLAACRCVCRKWRAAVDALELLQKLPRSLTGIFINYFHYYRPRFFARRPTSAQVDSVLDFIPKPNRRWRINIPDLCNGLLLCDDLHDWFVCNPATQQWTMLPRPGPPNPFERTDYLAFDPVASLHYHVIRFPDPEKVQEQDPDADLDLMEWPPSLFKMRVFSSITWLWEEREFVREGDAVVTLADVLSGECDESYAPVPWPLVDDYKPTNFCYDLPRRRNAVYWRGALYVHCRGDFITKLSLSDDKYQVIKTPRKLKEGEGTKSYLGRSEKRVYYATLDACQLWVCALYESSGPMEWIVKYDVDLKPLALQMRKLEPYTYRQDLLRNMRKESAWILDADSDDDELSCYDSDDDVTLDADSDDDVILDADSDNVDSDGDVILDDDCEDNGGKEWNSDDDYTIDVQHINMGSFSDGKLFLLGFHPFKEVVFLDTYFSAVAYHLGDSKAQYLGRLLPRALEVDLDEKVVCILESFPYTPCLTDLLPGKDN